MNPGLSFFREATIHADDSIEGVNPFSPSRFKDVLGIANNVNTRGLVKYIGNVLHDFLGGRIDMWVCQSAQDLA